MHETAIYSEELLAHIVTVLRLRTLLERGGNGHEVTVKRHEAQYQRESLLPILNCVFFTCRPLEILLFLAQ